MAAVVEPQVSRYQEYKPTGVEWMPEIPVGWELKKLKFVATINPSRDNSKLEESAESVIFLPMEAVGEDGSFRQDTFKALADVQSGYTYFEQDDVLLAKITPCFENGKATVLTGLLTPIGFGSTEFHVVRPKQGLTISRFLFYTVKSELFLRLGEGVMVGSAGQKRVPTDFLTEFPLPVPSLEEQEAIIQFLDDKTAQLDQLITQKQQMLALLREERAALINHAVTKGLDPQTPLRDSGVEWLGEVPAHWEILPIKRVATLKYGLGQPPRQMDGGLPIIRATNVFRGTIVEKDMMYVDPTDIPYDRDPVLRVNDIIIVRSGAYAADSAIVTEKYAGAITGYDMVLRATTINPSFMAYALLSNYLLINQLYTHRLRAAQPHLNTEELGESFVIRPPEKEQHDVVKFLSDRTTHIAETTDTINQEITLLQEYRAALIAEAVTGQFDVRHYAPVAAAVLM